MKGICNFVKISSSFLHLPLPYERSGSEKEIIENRDAAIFIELRHNKFHGFKGD